MILEKLERGTNRRERMWEKMKLVDIFYAIVGWLDFPSTSTPVCRRNLRHMDNGILQCAQYILALSQDKLEASDAAKFVTGWEIDTGTGGDSEDATWIITVTHKDGTQEQFDLPIEMLPTRIDLDEDGNLVIVQQDGETKKIDFQRFVYKFENTSTIAMHTNGTTITADVIDGSITMDKLEKSIMQTLRQYMLDAQAAADLAKNYNLLSESHSHGGTGVRPGEETDNSKYYSEIARREAEKAESYSEMTFPEFFIDFSDGHLYCNQGKNVEFYIDSSGHLIVEVA